ncbi:hypothetical protein ACHAXS_001888 [Conticribra weissflogii]
MMSRQFSLPVLLLAAAFLYPPAISPGITVVDAFAPSLFPSSSSFSGAVNHPFRCSMLPTHQGIVSVGKRIRRFSLDDDHDDDDPRCHDREINNDDRDRRRDDDDGAPPLFATRRRALQSLAAITSLSCSPFPSAAATVKAAKRSTAYLVDSTIPPTLIPYRAQREAAILKNVGMGGGTPKSPFIEDSVNLNNFMNKAVFGSVGAVRGAFDSVSGAVSSGGSANGVKKGGDARHPTFLFLGADFDDADTAGGNVYADAELAASLLSDVCKPKIREGKRGNTAIGLACVPKCCQDVLEGYLRSDDSSDAESELLEALRAKGVSDSNGNADSYSEYDLETIRRHAPLLRFAKFKRYPLLALGPDPADLATVSEGGLQSLSPEKREEYVADARGFIELTQDPAFKLYTEKSLLKDFKIPRGANCGSGGNDTDDLVAAEKQKQGNYFARRILYHEACATTVARWALSHGGDSGSLLIAVAPIKDVRFLGGINGRVPRICNYLLTNGGGGTGGGAGNGERDNANGNASPGGMANMDDVTTILLNPSAKETLSESKFLRLEIGTSPENWAYQTKVADYLWFSTAPKVSMLPRMMNEQ